MAIDAVSPVSRARRSRAACARSSSGRSPAPAASTSAPGPTTYPPPGPSRSTRPRASIVVEQPPGRAAPEPGGLRQLGEYDRPRSACDRVQQVERAVDRLDRPARTQRRLSLSHSGRSLDFRRRGAYRRTSRNHCCTMWNVDQGEGGNDGRVVGAHTPGIARARSRSRRRPRPRGRDGSCARAGRATEAEAGRHVPSRRDGRLGEGHDRRAEHRHEARPGAPRRRLRDAARLRRELQAVQQPRRGVHRQAGRRVDDPRARRDRVPQRQDALGRRRDLLDQAADQPEAEAVRRLGARRRSTPRASRSSTSAPSA